MRHSTIIRTDKRDKASETDRFEPGAVNHRAKRRPYRGDEWRPVAHYPIPPIGQHPWGRNCLYPNSAARRSSNSRPCRADTRLLSALVTSSDSRMERMRSIVSADSFNGCGRSFIASAAA